ncbi:MAG: efflux RND transporter periplasmic adaptor subunit [Steroidobacteraceae bacterium]
MPKTVRVALLLVVLAAIAAALWWTLGRRPAPTELTLYGNVDLRQVQLPFNDTERVAAVLVQEGDRVRKGQVLARLDTGRLAPQVAKAQAIVQMQQQVLLRLVHGNRPQEIDEAKANVAAALADAANAQAQYERMRLLAQNSGGRALSRQDLDAAKAASDSAEARLAVNQKALALEQLGPRREDIAQAQAQLRADQADLASAQQALDDAQLRAPLDSVVRSRLVEPGDIASPQQAAFTLAITDPKWVRAYVDEPDLGLVRAGMPATVTVDSFPGRRFSGWIGFISPVAEFTPKTVETTALRSSLVYELRVFVHDPNNELPLGIPATVQLSLGRGHGR